MVIIGPTVEQLHDKQTCSQNGAYKDFYQDVVKRTGLVFTCETIKKMNKIYKTVKDIITVFQLLKKWKFEYIM